jgi:hypothetical protein
MSNYSKPNTFFVGFAKCGTTTMAQCLDDHPEIYVSKPKEPDWFRRGPKKSEFNSEEQYLNTCFSGSDDHEIIIDANVGCIFDNEPIIRILNFCPEAKFILMIRNPIDAAYSLYSYYKSKYKEDADSFQEAWRLQRQRIKGEQLPTDTLPSYHRFLQYGEYYKFGKRIEWLYSKVSPERIHIVKLESFAKNPKKEYIKLLDFLDISKVIRTSFPHKKKDIRKKSKFMNDVISSLSTLKKKMGIPYLNTGFFSKLYDLISEEHKREKLDKSFRAELREYFKKDSDKLESLTGINNLNY